MSMSTAKDHPIRLARKRKNLTQQALAQAVGVTSSAVSRWESGIDEPTPRTAIALCKLLPGLRFEHIYIAQQGRAAA